MKRSEIYFTLSLVPIDILMILFGFVAAYFIRTSTPVVFVWNFSQYLTFSFIFSCIWAVIYGIVGLYTMEGPKNWLKETTNIIIGSSAGLMMVVGWLFITRTQFFSRLVILYSWLLSIVLVVVGRWLIRFVQRQLHKSGIGVHRLMIIGGNDNSDKIISEIQRHPTVGYVVKSIIGKEKIKYLNRFYRSNSIDEIILTDPDIAEKDVLKIINFANEHRMRFRMVPNLFKLHAINLRVDTIAGIPIIELRRTPLDGWGLIYKRALDITGATVGIIISSPLMLLTALLIKITSPGPVIFRNIRVGYLGEFEAYKFRSMFVEFCTGKKYGGAKAEKILDELVEQRNLKKGSAVYKINNDPRVTPLGGFIRKTSIDELPQLFNVLAGNMSLVGPRPHQPREVKFYTKEQRTTLMVKPGITGLAQISGRSDLTFDEEARLDIYYIENWTIWTDLEIIFKTFSSIFTGRGVY